MRYVFLALFFLFSCGEKEHKKEAAKTCHDCKCEKCECDLDGVCKCDTCGCDHSKDSKSNDDKPDHGSGGCHGGSCG